MCSQTPVNKCFVIPLQYMDINDTKYQFQFNFFRGMLVKTITGTFVFTVYFHFSIITVPITLTFTCNHNQSNKLSLYLYYSNVDESINSRVVTSYSDNLRIFMRWRHTMKFTGRSNILCSMDRQSEHRYCWTFSCSELCREYYIGV